MKANQHNSRLFLILVLSLIAAFANGKVVLTPQEKKAVATFRPLVNDIITHDYMRHETYLIRWMKARQLNVNDAVEMFKEAQKWRKANKIDSILSEDFRDVEHLFKLFNVDGVDYEGRQVFTSSLGDFDLRKLVLSGKSQRYGRFTQYIIEKAVSEAAERVYLSNGTLTDSRLVEVSDFQGFSLRKHVCLACIPVYTRAARDGENYYPGISGLGIYVNTPRVALPWVQSILSLVSEETRNAVKIFGTNRTEWTEYLRTVIPPDQLTYQFGGTKKI